jgi:hypothetical protein
MNPRSRTLAFGLLLVWFAWASAIQAGMATSARFGAATPDLSIVVLVCVAGAVARRYVIPVAILCALARKGFTVDPASALLTGTLALGGLVWALRGFIDVQSPPWRAALAAIGAGGLAIWLELVRVARHSGAGSVPELHGLLVATATSALAALALGGLLSQLPGSSPLKVRP